MTVSSQKDSIYGNNRVSVERRGEISVNLNDYYSYRATTSAGLSKLSNTRTLARSKFCDRKTLFTERPPVIPLTSYGRCNVICELRRYLNIFGASVKASALVVPLPSRFADNNDKRSGGYRATINARLGRIITRRYTEVSTDAPAT